jgi:multidrug efflux pump
MLGVTLFGIFLTPVFYFVIQWFKDRRPPTVEEADDEEDWRTVAHVEPIHHPRETASVSAPHPN